jgi:hypothetical protein
MRLLNVEDFTEIDSTSWIPIADLDVDQLIT